MALHSYPARTEAQAAAYIKSSNKFGYGVCYHCGKRVKDASCAYYISLKMVDGELFVANGSDLNRDELLPVGPDCGKRFPKDFLFTATEVFSD